MYLKITFQFFLAFVWVFAGLVVLSDTLLLLCLYSYDVVSATGM